MDRALPLYELRENRPGELEIRFQGRLDRQNVPALLRELPPRIRDKDAHSVTADLGAVEYFDDFGALLIFSLQRTVAGKNGGRFTFTHAGEDIQAILSQYGGDIRPSRPRPRCRRLACMVAAVGEGAIDEARNIRFMLGFIGALLMALFHVLIHPRSLRVDDTITHMEKTGVSALPIVALISFLIGLIMAFMSSMQFKQFGADIYVASLVSFAMVSELGPIMTAIMVAGRSGSAYAAEIGTMQISEEVDALFTMGFDPSLFLAVPRLIAAVVVLPVLTLFSNIFAIAGGMFVGVFMLDLSANTYMKQTLEVLTLNEIFWGLGKSVTFAVLIAWVGCLRGFQARGGASAVGAAATSAVVTSIFLIILFDSIFAVIRTYYDAYSFI